MIFVFNKYDVRTTGNIFIIVGHFSLISANRFYPAAGLVLEKKER